MNKKRPQLSDEWLEYIGAEFQKEYMQNLRQFLVQEKKSYAVYPPGKDIFNALNTTTFSNTRVVILGQDPYHGRDQAHGLSFSVNKGIPQPPSLQNIFQEIQNEIGIVQPNHGDLTFWAQQGVLLLNTTLTVRAGQARSHANQGWEQFTDCIIKTLNDHKQGLVFVLWGRDAKSKQALIDRQKHLILTSSHPSPYSAGYGFFGCGHFIQINNYLQQQGLAPINWQLPE